MHTVTGPRGLCGCCAVVTLLLWLPGSAAHAGAPTVPFNLELEEVRPVPPLPALHSFVAATADGKWLILGGRVAGLHGFADGVNNFPRTSANVKAYVIDPGAPRVLGEFDLTRLGPDLAGPLTSTNAQYLQKGDDLFVVGGYGQALPKPDMVTFDTVIRLAVKPLMKAIVDGVGDPAKLRPMFRMAHDPRLQVTGGELKALGDRFLLVFGHRFDGAYTKNLRDYNKFGGMQQHYTQKVRVFTLDDDLSIKSYAQVDGGYDASLPYNRRDLNVVETILADGKTPGLAALGGVFKAGQVAGQLNPIDMVPGSANARVQVTWVKGFQQALNHYDCARLSLFQGGANDTFVVLFGGISQYHYDKTNGRLVKDKVDLGRFIDGLPFIDTISVLRRDKNGEFAQYIWPRRLPGLIGAEARLFAVPSMPCFENGVVKLDELKGRTLVGYLFGGIEASEPYSVLPGGGTTASGRLFKVWVTPGKQGVLPMPPFPAQPKPATTAINEGNAALMAAFAKGDPVAAAAVYTEDAALFPPGKAPVQGRKAIEAFWRETMTAGIRTVKLTTNEVKSSGRLAYEVGRYELGRADGKMIDAGNYCVVWRRVGATWKLHRDMWNSMHAAE